MGKPDGFKGITYKELMDGCDKTDGATETSAREMVSVVGTSGL